MIEFLNLPWLDQNGKKFFLDKFPPESFNESKILIYGIWGSEKLDFSQYKGYKIICYSAENVKRFGYNSPHQILNKGHYLISMERIEHENYLRLPNIVRADFYGYSHDLAQDFIIPKKTKFCSFIQKNCSCSYRNNFVNKLSRYKKIDCIGRCLNNVNFKIPSFPKGNVEAISSYKFNIAFENSSAAGYCTEKIWWGFLAKTVSIYWGDPTVTQDFNQGSFLNRHEYNSDEEFIGAIIELDNDDDAYFKMLTKQKIRDKSIVDTNKLKLFFKKIINT